MNTVQDISDYVTPIARQILNNHQTEFKSRIKDYLMSKNFLVRAISQTLVEELWKVFAVYLLPTIVKIIIDVVIALSAPTLIKFIPLINKIIDYLSEKILSEEEKTQIRSVVNIVVNYKNSVSPTTVMVVSNRDGLVDFNSFQEQNIFEGVIR